MNRLFAILFLCTTLHAQQTVWLSWTNNTPGGFKILYRCNYYQQTFVTFGTNVYTTSYQPSTNASDWFVYCITEDQRIPIAAFENVAFFTGFEYVGTNIYPLNLTITK